MGRLGRKVAMGYFCGQIVAIKVAIAVGQEGLFRIRQVNHVFRVTDIYGLLKVVTPDRLALHSLWNGA